jgi:beta-lysine 5,6-aminomutase beta subunit
VSKVEVLERDYPLLSAKEVNAVVKRRLRRKLSVVGACIGTDAHTVGIDAILNVKGIAGEKGLEYYRELKVTNLGAQVTVPELVAAAQRERADAVLVSQVVTQRDVHKDNAVQLIAELRKLGVRERVIAILGGPRIDHRLALELGYDAGFGPGTKPSDVANYVVGEVLRRMGKELH